MHTHSLIPCSADSVDSAVSSFTEVLSEDNPRAIQVRYKFYRVSSAQLMVN